MSIEWIYFPQSLEPPELARKVVSVFESVESEIGSPKNRYSSNVVLGKVRPGLESLGFQVESGKKKVDKIPVPVFFGRSGKPEKCFNADAFNKEQGFVLEVEAGMAVDNYHYLRDIIAASLMVNVKHLAIVVRNFYGTGKGKSRVQRDFETVVKFCETLQASHGRLQLPLDGVLVIGY